MNWTVKAGEVGKKKIYFYWTVFYLNFQCQLEFQGKYVRYVRKDYVRLSFCEGIINVFSIDGTRLFLYSTKRTYVSLPKHINIEVMTKKIKNFFANVFQFERQVH